MKYTRPSRIITRQETHRQAKRNPKSSILILMNQVSITHLEELYKVESLRFRNLMTKNNMNYATAWIQRLSVIVNQYTEAPVKLLKYTDITNSSDRIDQRIQEMSLNKIINYLHILKTKMRVINNRNQSVSDFVKQLGHYMTGHINTRRTVLDLFYTRELRRRMLNVYHSMRIYVNKLIHIYIITSKYPLDIQIERQPIERPDKLEK